MKKSAFSLMELSIVLIIIGILVVGVSQGGAMISSARLTNARSATAKSPVPNINGLVAWYEASSRESFADNQAIDESQITEWYDISPASLPKSLTDDRKNTLTKTASNQVTYQAKGINNYPSVSFTADDRFTLNSLYQGDLSQITLFMVFKVKFSPSSNSKIPFDTINGRFSFGIKSNSINLNAGAGSDSGTSSNPANFRSGEDYITAAYFNQSHSKAYQNNASEMLGGVTINAGTNILDGISIGSDKNNNSGFTGLISEIIIYDHPLKLTQRKEIMRYLSQKYQIAVSGI